MSTPLQFKIEEMDCAEEVAVLKRALGPLVGGEERLAFDLMNARLIVAVRPENVSADDIAQAIGKTGMSARIWIDGASDTPQKTGHAALIRAFATVTCGLMSLLGLAIHVQGKGLPHALGFEGARFAHDAPGYAVACYSLAIVAGVWYVLPRAWQAARDLRPDMNLLMVTAIGGAIVIGEWFEGASVAFLFALSLALESWSLGRARKAVSTLMDLTPTVAHILKPDGTEEDGRPEDVPRDGRFRVRPGERIPLDGLVAKGSSSVNQAPITGESMPVFKQMGEMVFAGTINGESTIEVTCTKISSETTLSSIVRMVAEAQSRRAPSEQWVERFARFYTPAVIGAALLVWVVPPLFMGLGWSDWFYRALVLLVIGCPCALVISTPVSIAAALAAAARNGVLVKGGAFMEAPAHISAIAFDKTGTLTTGQPLVVEIVPLSGFDEEELLARAAALEAHSDHPVARAIVDCAQERFIRLRSAEDFRIIPGKGATARFDDQDYWIGSHRYFEERGNDSDSVKSLLEERAARGLTVVVLGNEEGVCGLIAINDTPRPDARETVTQLREKGLKRVVMLTGDNEGTAREIGRQTGMDDVYAELLPADKVEVMESLIGSHDSVAMVGDGVNDAPAMVKSSIGIAMGAAGSDTAIETADIALMSDDLSRLPWLIDHARRTLTVIRQNIGIALTIKALFVGLTVMGYASLWAAIGADMGASLLVIFNALQLIDDG